MSSASVPANRPQSQGPPRETLVLYDQPFESHPTDDFVRGGKRKPQVPALETKPNIQDVLNAILPPREWDQDGKHYVQYVSHHESSRDDVANLQKLLDERLLARQARESGICPIREELHAQCFDEIIRQVTIDCAERGLLLMRVRDELKMTIAAYQTLYQSSVTFGMRKQIQSEQGKNDLESRVGELEKRKAELQDKQVELNNKLEAIERRIQETKALEEARRKAELDFLQHQNSHLDAFLASLETPNQQK
eukprot:TRINITY_DN6994_c0_g1_i1.p1 TRINITY_DN6994_c0_g1~~TRINITY_DN6994_c0_g1_i1.p1  ORF type:complete len:251 (-),score=71.95 TRINITY_DN6994_c0_g1_i1:142-894(-)